MSKQQKINYGGFKNANRYEHKALVVLKFEEVEVNGLPQIYATGFDLARPDQKISIALMQEDGFRKNIAQLDYGITEKTDGAETKYFNTASGAEIPKAEYQSLLHNNVNIGQD